MKEIKKIAFVFLFSYSLIFLFANRFSSKEVGGDACYIHQPSYQEATCNAANKRDKEEDEACGVELQVGDESLAEDGEDRGEDIEWQAVAAEEEYPPSPFRGSNFIEPKQRGDGKIDNYK